MSEEDGQQVETEWESADSGSIAEDYADHEREVAERRARMGLIKMSEPGEYIFRFTPPLKGMDGVPFFRDWIHWFRNPFDPSEKPDTKAGRCPKKSRGLYCRGCETVSAILRDSNLKKDKKIMKAAKDMASREHFFAGVVTLQCPDELCPTMMKKDGGHWVPSEPKILQMPTTVFEALFDRKAGIFFSKEGGGDFTDPKTGFNIIINRQGKSMEDTEYKVIPSRRSTPIGNMDWLKHLRDPRTAYQDLTTAEINSIIDGSAAEEAGAFPPVNSDRQLEGVKTSALDMVEDPKTGEQVTRAELEQRRSQRQAGATK